MSVIRTQPNYVHNIHNYNIMVFFDNKFYGTNIEDMPGRVYYAI